MKGVLITLVPFCVSKIKVDRYLFRYDAILGKMDLGNKIAGPPILPIPPYEGIHWNVFSLPSKLSIDPRKS